MILLDTNVVSEAISARPNPQVIAWLNEQDGAALYLSSVSFGELRLGAELLPDGKRKQELEANIAAFLSQKFGPRLLAFDRIAAEAYAKTFADLRKRGITISHADCQIAATAKVHLFAIATRDVAPFREAGLAVINPWTDE